MSTHDCDTCKCPGSYMTEARITADLEALMRVRIRTEVASELRRMASFIEATDQDLHWTVATLLSRADELDPPA